MNYRLAYAIGFHPWEDFADHPPYADTLTRLVAAEENGVGPPFGPADLLTFCLATGNLSEPQARRAAASGPCASPSAAGA